MAIKKSKFGKIFSKPGAYSAYSVDNTGSVNPVETNVLFLLGESAKGAPGATEGVQEFNITNLDSLIEKYGSGPLVDCAVASARPSKLSTISGPSKILVYKTNASVQASATLVKTSDNMFTVKDRAYGLDGNLYTVVVASGSSASQKIISVTKLGGTTEELGENDAQNILAVQYTGNATTATLTIAGVSRSALTLTTTLAGDQSDGSVNLSITLNGKTMKQVADAIAASTGYTCTVATASRSSTNAIELDPISALNIKTAKNLLRLQAEVLDLLNTSDRIIATEVTQTLGGVPTNQSKVLTGGAKGASTNTNFATGLSVSLGNDYNVVVPCISRDASEDIADAILGFTDASSTYTIASVAAATATHLSLRADPKQRKEAQGVVGIRKSTKAAAYTAINTVASENVQAALQDVVFVDATGNSRVGHPHVFAALAAGMRCGLPVGEPLTFKFINVLNVGHFLDATTFLESGDFNPGLDFEDAIENGVLFTEKFANGHRIVVDNTTYGADGSFVYNRGSVVNAAYYVFKTLRNTAEQIFVGKKVSSGAASSIKSVLRNKLIELNAPDVNIITSSSDAPQGFREDTFVVTVVGNTASVSVEVKPCQGLDFVFISFTLGDISQSA